MKFDNQETDAAIAAWHEATAAVHEAATMPTPAGRFGSEEAAVARLEAEERQWHTAPAAAKAVLAAELAQGDPLAVASSPRSISADFDAFAKEEAAARQVLADLQTRRLARYQAAVQAHAKLSTRRRQDGLPAPSSIPALEAFPSWEAFLEALREAAFAVKPFPMGYRLGILQRELREKQAAEMRRIKEERERDQERAAHRAARDEEQARVYKANQERAAEHQRQAEKERAEEEKLAAQYRARVGG